MCLFPAQPYTSSRGCRENHCPGSPACTGRVLPASLPASLTRGSDAVKSNKGIETGRGSSQGASEAIGHEASHPKGTGHVGSHRLVPGRRRRRKKNQAVQKGQCNGVRLNSPSNLLAPPASTQQGLGLWLFDALPTGQGEMTESGISWDKALGG